MATIEGTNRLRTFRSYPKASHVAAVGGRWAPFIVSTECLLAVSLSAHDPECDDCGAVGALTVVNDCGLSLRCPCGADFALHVRA